MFESSRWRAQHWFDGLGMVYAFEIGVPSSVRFHSRLLKTGAARDAAEGKSQLETYATPLVRTLWQRILEPVARVADNTNVNIVKMGSELVAMTEGDRQLIIDGRTPEARGEVAYHDELSSAIMTPHPHLDFGRNRVVNVSDEGA